MYFSKDVIKVGTFQLQELYFNQSCSGSIKISNFWRYPMSLYCACMHSLLPMHALCILTPTCACIHSHISTCACMHSPLTVHSRTHSHWCMHALTHVCACTHSLLSVDARTHSCLCMYTFTSACACTPTSVWACLYCNSGWISSFPTCLCDK